MKIIVYSMLFAVLFVGCRQNEKTETTIEYKITKIEKSTASIATSYPATIRGRLDVDIYPQVSGKITRLCVNEGEKIRKGQVLFIIDQAAYHAALLTAEAAERAAKIHISAAELELRGIQSLFDKKIVSDYELAKAKNTLESAKAEYEQAKAQRMNAENSLNYTIVKSPVDGVVGKLPFREGTLVSEAMSKPFTTVSDNQQMYVYFSMSENELRRLLNRYDSMDKLIEQIPALCLELSDGTLYPHKGNIEAISGVIDAETGSVSIRAIFDNSEHLLLSGGIGKVILINETEDALVIPQSAVFEIQDKYFVYRIIDGKKEQTQVELHDLNDGKHYMVVEGLNVNDSIIEKI